MTMPDLRKGTGSLLFGLPNRVQALSGGWRALAPFFIRLMWTTKGVPFAI